MRYALGPVSMLYGPMEPNERFRSRRDQARRRRRRRRAAALGLLLAVVIAVGAGAQLVGGVHRTAARPAAKSAQAAASATLRPRPLPIEIRGVHVTGALASLPGRLQQFMALKKYGLNTIELDIKDEGGEIGFVPSSVPLAVTSGAARPFYKLRDVVRLARKNGIYLIGRLVTFQDPRLSAARPDLAVHRPDGSVWTTSAGLGWVNPYDRRVWDYNLAIAEGAAKAGFDQIIFYYLRFPS